MTKPWESGEEIELGSSGSLERGLCDVVRRVFEESSLSSVGPWSMYTEAEVDLDTRRVSLVIEIEPRCPSCGVRLLGAASVWN